MASDSEPSSNEVDVWVDEEDSEEGDPAIEVEPQHDKSVIPCAAPPEIKSTVGLALESIPIPESFVCPITQEIMEDPVVTHDGHVYDRTSIQAWFRRGNRRSPLTGMDLPSLALQSETPLKRAIDDYLKARPEIAKCKLDLLSVQSAASALDAELQRKSEQSSRNPQDETEIIFPANALLQAAQQKRVQRCMELIYCPRFQGINARDQHGRTVLHHAAKAGLADVCFAVLSHAHFTGRHAVATIEGCDWTAIELAVAAGHARLAAALAAYVEDEADFTAQRQHFDEPASTKCCSVVVCNLRGLQIDCLQIAAALESVGEVKTVNFKNGSDSATACFAEPWMARKAVRRRFTFQNGRTLDIVLEGNQPATSSHGQLAASPSGGSTGSMGDGPRAGSSRADAIQTHLRACQGFDPGHDDPSDDADIKLLVRQGDLLTLGDEYVNGWMYVKKYNSEQTGWVPHWVFKPVFEPDEVLSEESEVPPATGVSRSTHSPVRSTQPLRSRSPTRIVRRRLRDSLRGNPQGRAQPSRR
eukprot:TRINITY_DN62679_c0_g1_i1.p1 TRINITY_DN62679_c0_g1~~TRINITY_DN62679_c0_g1_i1.p1  ORF type:complete len:529 (+),score=65.77 TRINITY_DN62679_c0_g1_i1:44-1630(+)